MRRVSAVGFQGRWLTPTFRGGFRGAELPSAPKEDDGLG